MTSDLAARMGTVLEGKPSEVQGAVLAQLLGAYVAAHSQFGDEAVEQLLGRFIELVRALVPVYAERFKSRVGH
jgi:hypothetical protein